MQGTRTTGEVAHLLGLIEAQVNAILRRAGHIRPPLVHGRRRWRDEDVDALARHLGRAPLPLPSARTPKRG